jgi:integrase
VGIIDRGFDDWYLLRASDITTEMVRNRVIEIGKRQSNSIANRSLIVVKAVFAQAVKDGALVRNPAFGVAPLPTEKARKLIPKREDIDKVMELAGPLERAYLETILFTGARVGEINGLTWADVDFERRTLKLWTRKKKGGNRKYRTVHMVERVYAALQLVREWLGPLITPWVFNNLEMTKRHPFDVNKWRYIYRDKFLKTLCRKAGVLEFTYHHLRHYTASALAEAGVPLTTIQQILGHESAVTTNNYLQDLGRADTALEVL